MAECPDLDLFRSAMYRCKGKLQSEKRRFFNECGLEVGDDVKFSRTVVSRCTRQEMKRRFDFLMRNSY